MKKQIFISTFFLIFSLNSFSQENSEIIKSKWSGSLDFFTGNSILKDNNLGALNGNINTINFSLNYYLTEKKNIYLSTGLSIFSLNANFQNGLNQSLLNNSYFQIPLVINNKWFLTSEKKLYTKIGLGLYASYLFRSTQINYSEENKLKLSGINFGYLIDWGFGYEISENSSIDFGVRAMNDFNDIKNNNMEQKLKNIILLGVGYTHKF